MSTKLAVCLRNNLPPIGGETAWPPYKIKYHPINPKPIPDIISCEKWKTLTWVLASLLPTMVLIFVFIKLKILCKSGRQERQDETRPLLSDNPYQSTVEEQQ